MKKAEAGFRQKVLLAYRTCETVSAASFMTCAVLSRAARLARPARPARPGRR